MSLERTSVATSTRPCRSHRYSRNPRIYSPGWCKWTRKTLYDYETWLLYLVTSFSRCNCEGFILSHLGTQGQKANVIEGMLIFKIFYDGGRRTPWIDAPEIWIRGRGTSDESHETRQRANFDREEPRGGTWHTRQCDDHHTSLALSFNLQIQT